MNIDQGAEVDPALKPRMMSRAIVITIVLCASVALLDGFDTQMISLAAPDIGPDLGLPVSDFGTVFGIGLFGGLMGATAAGVIGDRIGRKPPVVFGVLVFGVVNLVTPFVGSVGALEVVRFLTGIGLGAALPGIISLTSEYVPARSRATTVALMWCGFPMGAVVAGVTANWLIPAQGWGSVFWVGGIAPLLLLPVLAYLLPESTRFLMMRGDTATAAKLAERMEIPLDSTGPAQAEPEKPGSPLTLFRQGYGPGTLLLWAGMFLTQVMTYFLVTWLPVEALQAGAQSGLLAVSTLNLGGIVGSQLIGRLGDRRTRALVLGSSYTLGALAIALIGQAAGNNILLLIDTFVAGFLGVGAQMVTISMIPTYYYTAQRATGVGWAVGWGRGGGIVGPVIGGWVIAAGLATTTVFLLAAGVCLCTALVVSAFAVVLYQRHRGHPAVSSVPTPSL